MSLARDIADLGSVTSRLDTVGASSGALSNRNFIINGDLQIFQRATGATAAANNYATADRFKTWVGVTSGAYTSEQSTDVPSGQGFSNSLKLQCTTADTSTAAGEYAQFNQPIEAQNCQAFAYGTSGAKTLTLSFWCKSNKTGVYTVAFRKADSTVYMLPIEYTISSADTWEKKTITVSPTSGSTTFITNSGGAIANDNGRGFEIYWNLLLGSSYTGGTSGTWSSNGTHYTTTNAVNWLDNTANNFYITGIQLEIGDTVTDFEHRKFSEELRACQRYFCRTYPYGTATGNANSSSSQASSVYGTITYADAGTWRFPVEMRAAPTVVAYSTQNANTSGKITADATDGNASVAFAGRTSVFLVRSNDSSGVAANAFLKAHATADAEL